MKNKEEMLNLISEMQYVCAMSRLTDKPIPSKSDMYIRDAFIACLNGDIRAMNIQMSRATNYWFNVDQETLNRLRDLFNKLDRLYNIAC